MAMVGRGGQIFYARSDLKFLPTGAVVPDVATQLTLLAGSRMVYGSSQRGVSVYDLERKLPLGQICTAVASPVDIVAEQSGDQIRLPRQVGRRAVVDRTTVPDFRGPSQHHSDRSVGGHHSGSVSSRWRNLRSLQVLRLRRQRRIPKRLRNAGPRDERCRPPEWHNFRSRRRERGGGRSGYRHQAQNLGSRDAMASPRPMHPCNRWGGPTTASS